MTVVGCSGSVPGPASPASCYLVRAGWQGREFNLLLDLGSGALGPLQRHLHPAEIDAVVLSHLHPDHCLDLCGLYVWLKHGPAQSRARRLPVHGPSGLGDRLSRAYAVQQGDGDLAGLLDFGTLADRMTLRLGPFAVTPYLVNHPVEAYGLRVEADGAVLAYTGDSDSCGALTPLSTGASLLLADAAFVEGVDTRRGIHLSARRAAEAAVEAGGVGRLMLTHLPPWADPQVCRAQAGDVWPGQVELAAPDATHEL